MRDALDKRFSPHFTADTFLKFDRDENGCIAVWLFFSYVVRKVRRALVANSARKVVIQHTACAQILAASGENCRLASQLLNLMATTLVTVDLCPASWP